jgi:hypothetical protein
MKNASMFLVGAVLLSMTPDAADARVVRLSVEQSRPFAGGVL